MGPTTIYNVTEILLKMALNTMHPPPLKCVIFSQINKYTLEANLSLHHSPDHKRLIYHSVVEISCILAYSFRKYITKNSTVELR